MSLEARVVSLAQAIGDDIQILLAQDGSLTGLTTTDKTSLVAAINEVAANSAVGALLSANNLSDLGDTASARTNLDVRSTAQVTAEISAAVAAITLSALGGLTQAEVDARVQVVVDSAPAALDTLNELAAALGDDPNFAATITAALGNKVDFGSAQTLTVGQQLQACQNIGVGDPEHDFVTDYTTSRDT